MNASRAFYDQINAAAKRDYPARPLHQLIDEQANRTPEAVAVLSEGESQTYAQLRQRSDLIAAYLQQQGIERGDLVGLCCNRDLDTPALLVGIMKSGAGYVPLDPDYPSDRLAFMVQDSGVKHVLHHAEQLPLVQSFDVAKTPINWVSITEQASERTGKLDKSPKLNVDTDVAYVIYTSGSTGKPKGVLVPHRSVVNMLWSMIEWPGFTSDDRILATTTLSFDISVAEMFLPLVVGGSVAVVDRRTAKDTVMLVAAMEKYEVTCMQATPAMWRMIVEADFAGRSDLKFITAGEPLPRDLIRPILDRCGEFWNMYGPTETTVYSSGTRVHNDVDPVLIGVPVANTQVYIVDEHNQLCPPEVPGELLIAGDGMTLGYLNRPELNAEKFVDWNGRKVYRTGDLAAITADGQIDHMGRIDNQIKFNGHRIELGEIDAAMSMQPGVRQAATVLREDRPGDIRLVGYLLAEENNAPNVSAVRDAIAAKLPDYMVPNTIAIVDEFPLTPSGKLDRKSFAQPSTSRPDIATDYVAAKTQPEQQLAAIWSDVLQIDQVGILDNFFELGGNSIRAVKVVALVKQQMNVSVTGAEFFDNPTIEAFLSLGEKKRLLASKFQTKREQQPSARREGPQQYAIVGMAARMPGASDLATFWDNLVHGRESITFFTKEELDSTLDPRDTADPNYVPARGVIDDATAFDARFFRTPPRNAELTCPQQRIMLELAWTALEDAGFIPSKSSATVGIWAGTYTTSYYIKNLLTNPDIVRQTGEFQLGAMNEKDYIATRVAHALNLTGPAINVNTACSTSLVALIEACKSLDAGHCDVALAGGASVTFPQNQGHLHQTGSIFTPDGHCRPFDSKGAGTLFSDGAGIVVVKRLEDAIANQDRIYAVVKGFGVNNDGGEKASFSAPSIAGQANAIAMAQSMAGVNPEDIGYIEAHGTATPIGDPIEVSALQTVFESQTSKKQFCAIGSVKSNIGHTVAAAGVAGLIKTALSLYHETIPATLHFDEPNPQIDFENSPFFVCDKIKEWKQNEQSRIAGVSSFGVGGTNAHVLLKEAPPECGVQTADRRIGTQKIENELPVSIIPISGKTEDALLANVDRVAAHFASEPELNISHSAFVLQNHRDGFTYRAAIVSDCATDATKVLENKKPPRFMKRKTSASPRDVVFMFPGQGSQYVRMGQNLYEHSDVFRDSLDRCAEILKPLLGRDLREVLFPPVGDEVASKEILKNTRFTQPALFSLGYSLAKVWMAWGIQPTALMGHSIGEFAAACVAGVFSLEDGLAMIAERGRVMQALPGGSMMSVRLPGLSVEPLLWGDMAIGSYNGPELCVVSGPDDQVAALQKKLESQDVVCRHLHTSHAFHSPMMDSIVDPFADFVKQFQLSKPRIPILSTVTGQWMTGEQATDSAYWAEHLRKPVRFSEAVTQMWAEEPSRVLIELGPRRTLATLSKQHATDPKQQLSLPTLSDNADGITEWNSMMSAVAQLWLAGVPIEWQRLSTDGRPKTRLPHCSLPTYAFQRKKYFVPPGEAVANRDATPAESPVCPVREAPVTQVTAAPPLDLSLSQSSTLRTSQLALESTMSRIPNLISAIHSVFENTSGFDLSEFEGDTTFFEMGLDSLVLTQTATALKKELGQEVSFRQLLEETPTVDSLAAWLDEVLPSDQYVSTESSDAAAAVMEVVAPAAVATPPMPAATPLVSPASTQNAIPPVPSVQGVSASGLAVANVAAANVTQPIPTPSAGQGTAMQAIVQSQLQLMQAQLQLLGGSAVSGPAVEATAHAPTQLGSADVDSEAVDATAMAACEKPVVPIAGTDVSSSKSYESSADDAPKAKRFSTVKTSDGELAASQQAALDEMIAQNNAMLPKSKAYAQTHRRYMADPRTVSGFRPNMKEMTHPIVVEKSKGAYLWDIDGNEYIDFTCGFGSNILGHTHDITVDAITQQVQTDYAIGPQSPLAGEVAKLFCEITGSERMAFSNTGSEAVLGCTRLARNATGRDLIVMFNGDYHGILDEVIARGSKKLQSFPAATGIPKNHVGNTLILEYGDQKSLDIIRERMDEIAAVLVEPVQSRTPELQPKAFLQELRRMTEGEPTCLIFDEVISGLRVGLGGAQEYFGIKADLASYGKIVGGGMPIGIVAGKAEYMDGLDGGFWQFGDDSRPEAGMTYFAGTFVRHPLALAASKAILLHLRDGGQPMYDRLNELGQYLADELNRVFEELDAPLFLANFGSLFKIQFHQDLLYSEVFFAGLRRRGMHIWDYRPCLLTLAHDRSHVDQLVVAMRETIVECQRHGFMPGEGYKTVAASLDASQPPQPGARVGKDERGRPVWFVADVKNPGQFVNLGAAAL